MKKTIWPQLLVILLMAGGCAYYNTFYNAKQSYKKAEKEREKRVKNKMTTKERRHYDDAIKKASKILEVYPNSKYVDDAVMLLGQCFYFREEYFKARRKFEELLEYFPDSEFAPAARVWLGRTLIELHEYGAASRTLREVPDEDRALKDESRFLLGEVLYVQEKYGEALAEFQEAAREIQEKEWLRMAYLRLGSCYLDLNEFQKAHDAFNMASKNSSSSDERVESELDRGRALKLMGRYQDAVNIFDRILEDATKERAPEIGLELGDTFRRWDKLETSIEEYWAVALDNRNTEWAARAYYNVGNIYEQEMALYDSAKTNYGRAQGAYPRAEIVKQGKMRSAQIDAFLKLKTNIESWEKSLVLADSTGQTLVEPPDGGGDGHIPEKARHAIGQEGESSGEASDTTSVATDSTATDGVPQVDSAVQDSIRQAQAARQDSIRRDQTAKKTRDIINAKMQMAETFLFEFDQPDSAYLLYDQLTRAYPKGLHVPKSHFAQAYILRVAKGDTARADSLLRLVAEQYAGTEHGKEANRLLGRGGEDEDELRARRLFREAERQFWNQNAVSEALDTYEQIAEEHPESAWAPKALLALGWIYENDVGDLQRAADSYRELLAQYPDSPHAKRVSRKVELFDRAARGENVDSLMTASTEGADTSAVAGIEEEWVEVDTLPPWEYDEPPRPLDGMDSLYHHIDYPEEERELQISGWVTIAAYFSDAGEVEKAIVYETSEHEELDQAALVAVKKEEWLPATKDGIPLEMWYLVRIHMHPDLVPEKLDRDGRRRRRNR